MTLSYDSVNVGDALPEFESPKISRLVLALFCGASGDHNPMHVDSDFAKSFGMPDVFAHGMLSMAYLGRLLTHWVPQSQLRSWNVRFLSMTPVNATIVCTGKIVGKSDADGERRVTLEINAHTTDGQHTLSGEAVAALP
ncbi:MAG: MaoC family dehydratase [Novosphingobium sp.]|nr:MaoC family dehydratase [Novosphingobium sp.]